MTYSSGQEENRKKESIKDDAKILYFVDEDGKKVKVPKEKVFRTKQNRGLYYIIRRKLRERRNAMVKRKNNTKIVAIKNIRILSYCSALYIQFRQAMNASVDGAEMSIRTVCIQIYIGVISFVKGIIHRVGTYARRRVNVWRSGSVLVANCIYEYAATALGAIAGFFVSAFGALVFWRRWTQKESEEVVEIIEESEITLEADGNILNNETPSLEEIQIDDDLDNVEEKFFFVHFFGGLMHLMRSMFLALMDVMVLVFIALGIIFIYIWQTIPAASTMLDPENIAETTILYDRTGKTVLYEIHGEENRMQLSHDFIPDYMRFATIAAEDDAFYSHFGIDPFSIARAVKENLLQGALAQGGSTITQQLARNVFFTREKTLERKVREAVMAVKIEQAYTKDEILDAYLNVVPYGSNAYGIQAASKIYFDKDARDLTLDEAAMIASLPKATTTFSPYGTHTNRLIARQKMILERMRELNLATSDAIDTALEIDTLAKIEPLGAEIVSPHFVFYVMEELRKKYDQSFIERGGLKVYTTIDLGMQAIGEEVVKNGVARNVRYGGENAALVAVDPRNGDILAMVGSKDYYSDDIDGQVNVTTRLRQPGSAFKPFAYAAAFAKGYQPETVVFDVLTNFGPDGSGRNYVPGNYTGRFRGVVSLRNSLATSLNIPAVKTLYLAGIDRTIDLAEGLGITSLKDRSRYGLALVLGGAEVKPLEITAAFGVFANDGVRAPAHGVSRIVDRDGEVVYDATKEEALERKMDKEVARKINSILSDNNARAAALGRNNALVIPGKTVAAKTGTTQNYRDAWTIGYTPEIAVGVWAGNNSGRVMYPGSAGAFVAAPIWQDFMQRVLANRDNVPFAEYVRVKTNVPMVGGRVLGQRIIVGENRVVGAQYKPEKKQEVRTIYHSILYYINKDNPLNSKAANRNDPMYSRWEASLYRSVGK